MTETERQLQIWRARALLYHAALRQLVLVLLWRPWEPAGQALDWARAVYEYRVDPLTCGYLPDRSPSPW